MFNNILKLSKNKSEDAISSKDAMVSGMAFSFTIKPQLPDNTHSEMLETLVNQSGMLEYFSEPRIKFEHENDQTKLTIRFWESSFFLPIDDPVYKEFHKQYVTFVKDAFDTSHYNCELLESGVMVDMGDVTSVVYFDKDGNHILRPGNELETMKKTLSEQQSDAINYETNRDKGIELLELEKPDEALTYFDKALESEPDDLVVLNLKGVTFARLKKLEDSIACFDKALEIDSSTESTFNNKGLVLNDFGKHRDAIDCFDKALELNPNYDTALYNKGNSFHDLGEYESAIDCFDKTLEINPEYEKASYNKNLALAELKKSGN